VKSAQLEICPILTQHFVYPFTNNVDPTLVVKLLQKNVAMLLDTGAHVSVLAKQLITETISIPDEGHAKRHVKAFGGEEIVLDGPVLLDIIICGVHMVHPFFYVDAEIPAIGGYDLLRAAHIIIDTHSAEVWSKQSCVSENIFATVQPQPLSNGIASFSTPDNASCVTSNTTTHIQEDTRPAVTDDGSGNTFPPTSCVTEDTRTLAIGTTPHSLNQFAPSFDPPRREVVQTETEPNEDELPAHINLLYVTIAQTRLTDDVDRQFRDVFRRRATTFAKDSTDLGFCSVLQHDVDTGDSPPMKQSPRRPSLSAGNAEDEILDDMLKTGVIEPSTSEWASPVCLVKKPDGSYRFCIDYRRVNTVSRKDGYPIPDIQDALDSLRGAKWFATLDLLSGYWQLGMTDHAKERSAFCTRRGLFQFCRIPFGLCGAPATFCRVMAHVLGDYIGKICLCYLDDVIIFGRTQKELLDRLDLALKRLHEFGLKVKPSKCVLFRTEIKFLGHLLSAAGV